MQIINTVDDSPKLGIRKSSSLKISSIRRYSAAEVAGLNVKDEIIAINNFRATNSNFDQLLVLFGDKEMEFTISRDSKLRKLKVSLQPNVKPHYQYFPVEGVFPLKDIWLRKD